MTQPRVRARVWDPTNPALLVPRLVGGGWTVNLGALAVRLGLLRPDDYDADVLPHIPRAATGAAHAAPVVLATGTCAALAASWRRLPDRVPTSWSATGRVQRTGPRAGLAALAGLGLGSALWSTRPTDPQDALVRAGIGASMTALTAITVAATVTDAHIEVGDRGRGGRVLPAVLATPLIGLATIVIPVRTGLRRLWDQEVGS